MESYDDWQPKEASKETFELVTRLFEIHHSFVNSSIESAGEDSIQNADRIREFAIDQGLTEDEVEIAAQLGKGVWEYFDRVSTSRLN